MRSSAGSGVRTCTVRAVRPNGSAPRRVHEGLAVLRNRLINSRAASRLIGLAQHENDVNFSAGLEINGRLNRRAGVECLPGGTGQSDPGQGRGRDQ